MNVPTLLIGLGGTGSEIVASVYNTIPYNRRSLVAVQTFDTDVNSLKKLPGIGKYAVQTSTMYTVGQYLNKDVAAKEWFPSHRILDKKSMIEGAGQVRATSRLAFRSAMAAGKLHSLDEAINSLFPVSEDAFNTSVRVMVVSSLAGGTGSGIFLQIAMYLREILETKFNRTNVLIRGVFLMPDIFTTAVDETEWENIRANGYAAMKELNAITLAAVGGLKSKITIELEYRPNQVDLYGHANHAITQKQLPYDYCFLFDNQNTEGKLLANIKCYKEQVARCIYLQLFSPITEGHFSMEDNQIRNLIESAGRNRFCGAGASLLQYPFEDNLNYLSLKWATEGMDEAWLYLDGLYDKEVDQYAKDLRNGVPREKPDKGLRYIKNFETLAQEDSSPFFRQINRQVNVIGEKGRVGASKADEFIKAAQEYIYSVLEKDIDLEVAESDCHIDTEILSMKDRAQSEIARIEDALGYYRDKINKVIVENRAMIAHQILLSDADTVNGCDGQDYRLNTWILAKPEPIHPVGVRYLLYRIQQNLKAQMLTLTTENEQLLAKIRSYENEYDISDTEDRVESAGDRIRMAMNQGFIGSIFKNEFKEFVEEYTSKAGAQLYALSSYKKGKLMESVFSLILEYISSLTTDMERFFESLKDVRNTLLNEINILAVKHDREIDRTTKYVLASREHKNKLWDGIKNNVNNGVLPVGISQQIYLSIYRAFSTAISNKRNVPVDHEETFRKNVVEYCRDSLRNEYNQHINLNIIRALRKEAEFLGYSPEEGEKHIEQRIRGIGMLARPFIPQVNEVRELEFWGIHKELQNELTGEEYNRLFGTHDVADEAFSPYEVICYTSHYGLKIEDFNKFSSGIKSETHNEPPGIYYAAYNRCIMKLTDDGVDMRGGSYGRSPARAVTPHIDKRWHLPAFMPDINRDITNVVESNINSAFIYGIAYGWFQLVNEDGIMSYLYLGKNSTKNIFISGRKVGGRFYELHDSLSFNPSIFDEILKRVEEKAQQDSHQSKNPAEHSFMQNILKLSVGNKPISNLLDVIINFQEEAPPEILEGPAVESLLKAMVEVLTSYSQKVMGSYKAAAANRLTADLLEQLWEGSTLKGSLSKDSPEYIKLMKFIESNVESLRNHV